MMCFLEDPKACIEAAKLEDKFHIYILPNQNKIGGNWMSLTRNLKGFFWIFSTFFEERSRNIVTYFLFKKFAKLVDVT